MKHLFAFSLCLCLLVGASACSDDDEKIDDGIVGNPECVFNSETGEYKVRLGKETLLSAHVTNAANPVYSWKQDGEIMSGDTLYYFKGERLEDIAKTMNRWYGKDVVFLEESIKDKLFTGILDKGVGIEVFMRQLSETSGIKFVVSGNQLFIK